MTVNVTSENSAFTFMIEGRIDTITAPELEAKFKEIRPHAEKVTFDMTGVEYISSAGMRTLVAVHRAMSSKGGLTIKGLTKNVQSIINLTGFNKILNIEE